MSTWTPDQAGEGGNQISVMRVPLHTDIDDPLLRLAAIHDTTIAKKAAQDGVAVPVLLDVARVLPGALIGAAARALGPLSERGPVLANTIVTNVPGSPVPLYFLGCELVHSTGAVPWSTASASSTASRAIAASSSSWSPHPRASCPTRRPT